MEIYLLRELIVANAPDRMLLAEGFTPNEIRGARADVSLEQAARAESSPRMLAGQHMTPATRDGGATGSDQETTAALEGAPARILGIPVALRGRPSGT